MSWYTDGEPFDEHEPEYCKHCTNSACEGWTKADCDRCIKMHEEWEDEDETD